jgi:hypothetical protein
MNKVKTLKYIADTSIDDILKKVKTDNLDISYVIRSSLEARKEIGIKIQQLVSQLSELVEVENDNEEDN